jgi:hypothetical protein
MDLRDVPQPPELTDLQCQLAMDQVLDEMGIPGGLKLDEPVVDAVTQYKSDVRMALLDFPQDLDTQLAGKEIMSREFIVPPAETAPPVEPPPEPIPPELVSINPTEGPLAGGGSVLLGGGPWDETSLVVWNDASITTERLDENRLSATVPPGSEAGQVTVYVTQGEFTTSSLSYTYTEEAPQPEVPPETVSGTPIVEGA